MQLHNSGYFSSCGHWGRRCVLADHRGRHRHRSIFVGTIWNCSRLPGDFGSIHWICPKLHAERLPLPDSEYRSVRHFGHGTILGCLAGRWNRGNQRSECNFGWIVTILLHTDFNSNGMFGSVCPKLRLLPITNEEAAPFLGAAVRILGVPARFVYIYSSLNEKNK